MKNNPIIKVGVDARILSRPLTGIGRYTLEMCHVLCSINNISLFLYSPAPILNEYIPSLEGANIRTKNFSSGISRQIWGESLLPFWSSQDDVDVFWGPAHRLPLLLSRKIARTVTIHDLVWKFAPQTMRPMSKLLEQLQMPRAVLSADIIIADSQSTALAVIDEFNVKSERVTTITLGANPMPVTKDMTLSELNINTPYILFVGTLEPRKNLLSLLKAYANLPEAVKAQALLVISGGKGWGGIQLKNIITSLKLEKHIRLTGYVEESALNTLYANALFLAMPSLYEGFGLPLVEAMSHGKPVLTSNNSSMPEVTGDAGLLVDAEDVNSISDGLNQLITNDDLRNKLASNAKKNAARFSWTKSANALALVFEQAISIKKAHAI